MAVDSFIEMLDYREGGEMDRIGSRTQLKETYVRRCCWRKRFTRQGSLTNGYPKQYFGEIKNKLFLRTRPEILLFEPPHRFGPATAQTKAVIHTTT